MLPLAFIQDPQSRPTTRRALPPIQEPIRTRVERADLLQQFVERSPLEGFYALRAFVRAGQQSAGKGYAWFGRDHCMIATSIARGGALSPFVQSGVCTYRLQGDKLVMTTLIGHDHGDEVRFVAPGFVEVRRFLKTGTSLRVYQGGRDSYMEFVRVE